MFKKYFFIFLIIFFSLNIYSMNFFLTNKTGCKILIQYVFIDSDEKEEEALFDSEIEYLYEADTLLFNYSKDINRYNIKEPAIFKSFYDKIKLYIKTVDLESNNFDWIIYLRDLPLEYGYNIRLENNKLWFEAFEFNVNIFELTGHKTKKYIGTQAFKLKKR